MADDDFPPGTGPGGLGHPPAGSPGGSLDASTDATPDGGPPADPPRDAFRLLLVPGTTPAKWLRTWADRVPDVPVELVHAGVHEQVGLLRAGAADAGLVRLPERPEDLSAIPLYTEATVVVVPKDHLLTAADEVTAADLVEETLLVPADDVLHWADPPGEASLLPTPETTAAAVELVAAGAGVLVVPQSLARLHHRRDLAYRTVTDAPTSSVALAWPTDRTTDRVETFIGIVRGRTANSSRGPAGSSPEHEEGQPRTDRRAGGAVRGAARGGRPRSTGRPAGDQKRGRRR